MTGLHKHKCECGKIWEHENLCSSLDSECAFNLAHTCPNCGTMVTEKYRGVGQGDFRACFTPEQRQKVVRDLGPFERMLMEVLG